MTRELLALTAADGAGVDGAFYLRSGAPPSTALVLMHPTVSFLHHYALIPLARRGYGALGLNSRFAGNEAQLLMEQVVLDLAAGVAELRERGFEHVVLVGNSGGGALAAFYQAQAEKPVPGLPRADALIILNAHRGRPQVLTAWLDPSVTDESDPLSVDTALDMFERRNGPHHTGRTSWSDTGPHRKRATSGLPPGHGSASRAPATRPSSCTGPPPISAFST